MPFEGRRGLRYVPWGKGRAAPRDRGARGARGALRELSRGTGGRAREVAPEWHGGGRFFGRRREGLGCCVGIGGETLHGGVLPRRERNGLGRRGAGVGL